MFDNIIYNTGIIQVIGVFSMVFSLLVFQANNRKQMLRLNSVANFLYFIHLYLLNGITGSITSLLIVVRNLFFVKYKNNAKTTILPILFIFSFIIIGYLTWEGWTSLLPIIGAILGTIAYWQKRPKLIRLITLFVAPLWFAYGLSKGSYPIMLTEVIIFASDVFGIIRYDLMKKRQLKLLPFKGLH